MTGRIHAWLLGAFVVLLALFEGPAQIACVAVVLSTVVTGRWRRLRPGPIELGICVWALAGLPGLLTVEGVRSSEDVLRPLMALAFVVGAAAVDHEDERQLSRLAWMFVAAIVLNGAWGYLQMAFGELPVDRWLLKNRHSPQIWVPGNWGSRVASGLYYNRLKLAHVGIIGLGVIGLTLATARPIRRRTVILGTLGGLTLGGAVVLTYARMALLAMIAAAGIVVLLMARRRVVLGVAVVAAGLGGALALTKFGAERLANVGGDLAVRRAMAGAAWAIFTDHPIAGVGHGGYRAVAPAYLGEAHVGVRLTSPHNLGLQILDETGLIGFAGFGIALMVGLVIVARRVHRSRADSSGAAVRDRLVLFGLLALSGIGLTHFTLHHAPVAMAFWALLGMAAGASRANPTGDSL